MGGSNEDPACFMLGEVMREPRGGEFMQMYTQGTLSGKGVYLRSPSSWLRDACGEGGSQPSLPNDFRPRSAPDTYTEGCFRDCLAALHAGLLSFALPHAAPLRLPLVYFSTQRCQEFVGSNIFFM